MPTIPRLLERHSHRVLMTIRSNPAVRLYRFGSANTLDTAFGGTTAMFDVFRGRTFRSPSIRSRGWGFTSSSLRGLTMVTYDPEDYQGGTVPGDGDISFLRIAEQNGDGTLNAEGPILVVPPPSFLNSPRPHLSVSGTAPDVAVLATKLPPAGAMHFAIPRHADSVKIRNLSATNSLFVSFDPGQPEYEIPFGETENFFDATVNQVFVHGDGATVAFSAYFALVNGAYE